ncbi:helix-turn-helix domain-containing protein [Paractinoplanes rhizophilus]|uniref:Helix-turn-helix domain-containing protein n=1 Tax=Paractinoplanes rhizophilus TaxID=1416877 RepID=A0ABW2HUX5_9ACTN
MTSEPSPGLGAAIRRRRIERGLSQPQLAEKLGISVNAVSQFERGVTVPGVYTLSELASVLGVTYGVLFDEPLALAEHAVAQVRDEVRALGYDLALIPIDPRRTT